MTIDVTPATDVDAQTWDDLVDRSPQGTFFHQHAALEAQATHSGTELHRLIGYKGQEPVGLFPVFELRKGPIVTAFSPPPYLWVPTLGPAMVNMAKLKQRKAERRRRRFTEGVLDYVTDELSGKYLSIRTGPAVEDARPYRWNDCEISPGYTYVVDLTPGQEAVKSRFSSDARRNIRSGEERSDEFTISDEGVSGARLIIERVRERYDEQDEPFSVPADFVVDLYENVSAGEIRPLVCRVDGAFAGGLLAIEYDDTIYRWIGGAKPDREVDLPVNDLIDWHVMRDAIERGLTSYDLVGAGTPRINDYKLKFGPELRSFYTIDGGSRAGRLLVDLYRKV